MYAKLDELQHTAAAAATDVMRTSRMIKTVCETSVCCVDNDVISATQCYVNHPPYLAQQL